MASSAGSPPGPGEPPGDAAVGCPTLRGWVNGEYWAILAGGGGGGQQPQGGISEVPGCALEFQVDFTKILTEQGL